MKKILLLIAVMALAIACSAVDKSKQNYTGKTTFNSEQVASIMADEMSLPMRVLQTNIMSDSLILRTSCSDVEFIDNDIVLNHFINRLYHTVTDSNSRGVGIAAPQVGILKNIIWVQRFDKEGKPFEVYINPRIIHYSDRKQNCFEGCLSIPDRRDTTKTRSHAIMLEYFDRNKQTHKELIEDFTAVIFQHEIDHLRGILYTDRIGSESKQNSK